MSALHVVALPGIEPGLFRGYAMILELEGEEAPLTEEETAGWDAFAADAKAHAFMSTSRSVVVLGPYNSTETVPAGPCPSYMDSLGLRLSAEPILGVCQVNGCERPTLDSDYCEVHKDPAL